MIKIKNMLQYNAENTINTNNINEGGATKHSSIPSSNEAMARQLAAYKNRFN